jgi:two-component system, OmpR family, sensor kinase
MSRSAPTPIGTATTEHRQRTLTEAVTRPPQTEATSPPATDRWRVPARLIIMFWVMVLMFTVLAIVLVVTRNLALQDADLRVRTSLEQEKQEFIGVARAGMDRVTQRPFTNVEELLYNHVHRQYPKDNEVIFGVVSSPAGNKVLGQDRVEPFTFSQDPQLVATVVASNREGGSFHAPGGMGEVHWIKVNAGNRFGNPETVGSYVVGYLVSSEREAVNDTVETLAAVSLGGLLLAGLGAWVVSGQMLLPVRLVRQAAAEITEQDLRRRIPITGSDDVSALAMQFNAMLDRLDEAFSTQRQFLDDASHELRTPITIVRGHLELMDDDPAERAEVVRLATEELDRMSRIVEDLLVLAKARRPDFTRLEEVSVAELTSDIHAKVRTLGDRRWTLAAVGENTAVVDPQRVTQAVVQLAQNAVQHTSTGDEIRIGSALHSDGGADRVLFWVIDTGPGVKPEDADSIFERFSCGSTDGARSHHAGAGLGLAIVRAIADAHHGSVRLLSEPGVGATFSIDLPAQPTVTDDRGKATP